MRIVSGVRRAKRYIKSKFHLKTILSLFWCADVSVWQGAKDSSAAPQGAQQPNTTTDGVNDDWAIVDSILELGSSTFAICILVVLVSFLVYWFNIFP